MTKEKIQKEKKPNDPLANALALLNKEFTKDSPFITTFTTFCMSPLSTGILPLDRALGGGIARGKIIEVFGPEGEGKTTLCLHFTGLRMHEGDSALWFDAEDSLDVRWASRFG